LLSVTVCRREASSVAICETIAKREALGSTGTSTQEAFARPASKWLSVVRNPGFSIGYGLLGERVFDHVSDLCRRQLKTDHRAATEN
jgi:hypothetical protein